jgi:hypothetical protein
MCCLKARWKAASDGSPTSSPMAAIGAEVARKAFAAPPQLVAAAPVTRAVSLSSAKGLEM